MDLKDNVCGCCRRVDKSRDDNAPFLYSAANDMDPGDVPTSLPVLTQVEEMLIAPVHVYVVVRQIRGQQYKYTGNVVIFHRKTSKLYNILTLAYAITVHKSQGIAVNKAVLDISSKKFTAGLTYVAISRVKKFGGLLFTESFDYQTIRAEGTPG